MTGTMLLLAKLDEARLRQHTGRLSASKVICVRDKECYEPLAFDRSISQLLHNDKTSHLHRTVSVGNLVQSDKSKARQLLEIVTLSLASVNLCEYKVLRFTMEA